MDEEQFAALMPVIVADFAGKISEKQGIPEEEAIRKLYASKLYALLEQEDTKVWYYSSEMLYALYEQEESTGEIHFPDV